MEEKKMQDLMKEYVTTIKQVEKFEEHIKENGFNSLQEFYTFMNTKIREIIAFMVTFINEFAKDIREMVKDGLIVREELEEMGLEFLLGDE